ncbi:hypothetical protein MAHJHV57_50520 [Mycobacterium avium subsp. hominissuis]
MLAAAGAQRGAAVQRKRHVAAQPRGEHAQIAAAVLVAMNSLWELNVPSRAASLNPGLRRTLRAGVQAGAQGAAQAGVQAHRGGLHFIAQQRRRPVGAAVGQ